MYILGIKIVFPCQINSYVVLVRTVNNILLNLYSSLITTIFHKMHSVFLGSECLTVSYRLHFRVVLLLFLIFHMITLPLI